MGGKLVGSLRMIRKSLADGDRSKPKEWIIEVCLVGYKEEMMQNLKLARSKPINRTIRITLRRRCRCTSSHERSRC
jgi:hypothetical protein